MKQTFPGNIALTMLVLAGCATRSEPVQDMGVSNLTSQRLSGTQVVKVAGGWGFSSASVLVTVGIDGKVIDAKIDENPYKIDPHSVLAAARTWTFRPQTFEGQPIRAIGDITIEAVAPEIRPDTSVPFPSAAPANVTMTLERTSCLGTCPGYKVSVTGNGQVRFAVQKPSYSGAKPYKPRQFGDHYVLWSETHETTVSAQAAADLFAKFREAHFMGLKPSYFGGGTDGPTFKMSLRVGKTSRQVSDYIGQGGGMPASVTALEEAVDAVAGTERWTRGNAQTVALLKAQGFNFGSQQAADMVLMAIWLNTLQPRTSSLNAMIRAALAAGLDPALPVGDLQSGNAGKTIPLGTAILRRAVETGDDALFGDIMHRGLLKQIGKEELSHMFTGSLACNAQIAKALVAAGANPKANGENGNALHAVLTDDDSACTDSNNAKRLAMARTLVALGVPPDGRNDSGRTALMRCDNPELAQILLKAGANPDARTGDGTTPLLAADDDRVAIILLRAGADPKARNTDGSVRQHAVKAHWPATLAWLDAHDIR
jgi:hypothetical protein